MKVFLNILLPNHLFPSLLKIQEQGVSSKQLYVLYVSKQKHKPNSQMTHLFTHMLSYIFLYINL